MLSIPELGTCVKFAATVGRVFGLVNSETGAAGFGGGGGGT